jgi:1,2-diacylglycerol 3-beta-galactosyltransferase
MGTILKRLSQSDLDVQLILVCGHNHALAEALRATPTRIPKLVEGFTREVPYFMHVSDFFVGKPGPGSISEALRMGLPLIVERNAWTLPQERYNATWVRDNGVGIVVSSMRQISDAVRDLLVTENFERYRRNAAAMENRAVFEIPDMIGRILSRETAARRRSDI